MSRVLAELTPWIDEPVLEAPPPMPPTQEELPCEDGIPMETQRHKLQMDLLIDTLDHWLAEQGEGYVNGNMFVYYSLAQTRGLYFRGPDVFVVLSVSREPRRSWVIWQEEKGPDLIIELLSESTAAADKGEKKRVYQDQMRVPEYFRFDPFNPADRAGFALIGGRYEPLPTDADGNLWSARLGLKLTLWSGRYLSVDGTWLRWTMPDGTLLPTWAEAERAHAQAERQRAESALQSAATERARADAALHSAATERARADAEQARAERLAAEVAQLRAMLTPDPPAS